LTKKKEITKIRAKKIKDLTANKRIKEREPDLWKEVYSGLKLLGKKYKNFKEKQKIKKQKEEQRRLKEQEERKLQKEQKLKEEERQRLEEEQKPKEEQRPKEEGRRLNGKVKWFDDARGYGFIERKDGEKDIFVHFSAVKKSGLKYLEEGEQLTFEIKNSDKGPSAINLQKASVLKLVK